MLLGMKLTCGYQDKDIYSLQQAPHLGVQELKTPDHKNGGEQFVWVP